METYLTGEVRLPVFDENADRTQGAREVEALELAAIEAIEQDDLLEHAKAMGEIFRQRLTELAEHCDIIQDVRVQGVMIGVELSVEGAGVVRACMDRSLLVNCTQSTVIRLLPAMNVTEEQVNEGIDILAQVLQSYDG